MSKVRVVAFEERRALFRDGDNVTRGAVPLFRPVSVGEFKYVGTDGGELIYVRMEGGIEAAEVEVEG